MHLKLLLPCLKFLFSVYFLLQPFFFHDWESSLDKNFLSLKFNFNQSEPYSYRNWLTAANDSAKTNDSAFERMLGNLGLLFKKKNNNSPPNSQELSLSIKKVWNIGFWNSSHGKLWKMGLFVSKGESMAASYCTQGNSSNCVSVRHFSSYQQQSKENTLPSQ